MDVAKKYHGMIEKTIYVLEEVVIIAQNEQEAEDKLLDRDYEVIGSEIQEESINNEWINSSEPLSADEYLNNEGFH